MKAFVLSALAICATSREFKKVSMDDFEQLTFTNVVDHFATDINHAYSYQQRYWMNDQFWLPKTGPVFLYLCGEWTCSPPDTHMYPFMVGADHNALLVTLEHRYYGDSQPFSDWSTNNLWYLSSDQALADTAYFIEKMNDKFESENGVKPDWVVIGGSYPGALSAWFHSLYPFHTIGAWSSSGVINAIYDFHEFDNSLYTSMSKSGPECPNAVIRHYTWIEEQFKADNQNVDVICEIFGIDPMTLNKKDFFWYLSDIYTMGVQYGDRSNLCEMLISTEEQEIQEQLLAVKAYGDRKGVNYYQYDAVALQDTKIDINKNLRQWTYQYCTEFGFFQTPMNETTGMRS